MKERPILFSAPMVRAILAGTKTQTRRVVKQQPVFDIYRRDWRWESKSAIATWSGDRPLSAALRGLCTHCPYGETGDRLWVRETFAVCGRGEAPVYRADSRVEVPGVRWKPSIFMRRMESRITLGVTGVRVERLQEISEADAKAEGVERDPTPDDPAGREDPREVGYPSASDVAHAEATKHRRWYAALWDDINGNGSWASNPWVWVVEFRRVQP